MIVLDASAVVDLLLNDGLPKAFQGQLNGSDETFLVPHLLDVEVLSAIRRLSAAQRIEAHRAELLLRRLVELPAERYSHAPLLGRIWELRHNFSAYDATYIALAEATGSVLYTRDAKLRRGHRARVVVLTAS
jgi:predicted nucleic acid-binding protein